MANMCLPKIGSKDWCSAKSHKVWSHDHRTLQKPQMIVCSVAKFLKCSLVTVEMCDTQNSGL